MPTGACGINCDVCRLNLLGICSTCGSGRSVDGKKKAAAQQRILGAPCPILACSMDKAIDYCPRDCNSFPCDRFKNGPYPFSRGFLNMQARRRTETPSLKNPSGDEVDVPIEHWEGLLRRDQKIICQNALVVHDSLGFFLLPFLKEYIRVDLKEYCLYHQKHGGWEIFHNPLLELVCLVYLLHAGPQGMSGRMAGPHELKAGHFFKGPHELKTQPLVERYGFDIKGFKKAAENLGGEALDMADAAYRFEAFPKIPLYYLLWEGDVEFQARLSVLFDHSIEHHLTVDAIWGLVALVSDLLLVGGHF
ncbi:MAG: DUF3786 domain-containing protein [Deltaproteobacteria bacterium]|nr:DUF3786 domain-containing protein [Deltaproteobacteria bacterium]